MLKHNVSGGENSFYFLLRHSCNFLLSYYLDRRIITAGESQFMQNSLSK